MHSYRVSLMCAYFVLSNASLQKLRESYRDSKKRKSEQLTAKVQQLEAEVQSLKDALGKCQCGGGGAGEMEADR